MKLIKSLIASAFMAMSVTGFAIDNVGITTTSLSPDRFTLIQDGKSLPVYVDDADDSGVKIAVRNLAADFGRVTGHDAVLADAPSESRMIIVGTIDSPVMERIAKAGKIDASQLKGKYEKYLMSTVQSPLPGVDEALVIAGSDRRGAIYGVYELSEQIGVSPWYDWADVPVAHNDNMSMSRGTYTAGEPAVKYRGLFLNDEAPCLTGWVKNTYGTDYGDHRFYARVFELILRLRGNMMWPAMWGWAFYADDPENSKTADDMGVVMGTSHHEPMARNHQEWARRRGENGPWNYATNRDVIDRFFVEGIERAKNTEDIVTIGMRGDGDEAMSAEADVKLLKEIINNQRKIISKVTRKKASATPQVWALYKEVLDYYDKGLRAPDDVIYLLCDDNWGNVRRLPNADERRHPGGWGMYYHVDYVGAPRNSKWLNVTPIQNMWEQLSLTYKYGVDKLWILNVGDLKPMEYPITLFMDMAWRPEKYSAHNLLEHTLEFCRQQFGEAQAPEAARILNLYSKYNGRVTAEMLDRRTYNLSSGEWRKVADEYVRLEAEAMRQYMTLEPQYRDAYKQLILFPVQAMSNIYEMYYAQAMNLKLFEEGNPEANEWADKVERCFNRDAELMRDYNEVMADGKWNGMMTQKHIGYRSWNDNFRADTMPMVKRIDNPDDCKGDYVFTSSNGVVSMEAEHYYSLTEPASDARWTVIPYMGRTLSGMSVMPPTEPVDGASLTYRMTLPDTVTHVTVRVVVKSTLDFLDKGGLCYTVALDGGDAQSINFNSNLNEKPENIYSVFYPTVAGRVVEKSVTLPVKKGTKYHDLVVAPSDPGIVFEKIVVDFGGYTPSFLFMDESSCSRNSK